jgi:hypothetical protein
VEFIRAFCPDAVAASVTDELRVVCSDADPYNPIGAAKMLCRAARLPSRRSSWRRSHHARNRIRSMAITGGVVPSPGTKPCADISAVDWRMTAGRTVPARQPWHSTATSSAAQTSRMRSSLSRPRRSTRTPTDTLSTESRLIEDRRGTGSSSGSRTTSLAKPRMVVVHGATSARLKRGIAASRDSTTTGRRPISGNSHHHTSALAGRGPLLTMPQPPLGTTPDRPTHRPPRADARRRPRMRHRSR